MDYNLIKFKTKYTIYYIGIDVYNEHLIINAGDYNYYLLFGGEQGRGLEAVLVSTNVENNIKTKKIKQYVRHPSDGSELHCHSLNGLDSSFINRIINILCNTIKRDLELNKAQITELKEFIIRNMKINPNCFDVYLNG